METQAFRQHNPCIVRPGGTGNTQFTAPIALCVLILETDNQSSCRVAENLNVIPFHISLIYSSHSWHVNSAEPSWWLTLFNDFIHAFRMQVFFVISGYFSYMLFLRYPLKKWWKVRVERVGIPMLTAIPLLTLPQFIMLQYVNGLNG